MRARARSNVIVATALLLFASAAGTALAGPAGQPLGLVSPGDPYAACGISGDGPGVNYPSAEEEPYVSANPRDPRNVIGVFQQDRWSNGGARGLSATYSTDGTHFTQTALPFSHCAPGGVPYQRASDGWVSFGPDGTAYASGLVFDATTARNGVAATTSHDGGRTWKNTTQLIADTDPAFADDKNSVTADPVHPGVAYQVWDRIQQVASGPGAIFDGPAYLSTTRDSGRTWSKARPFVDTGAVPNSQTIGNIIVADPRTGTLYDFFEWQTYSDVTATTPTDLHFAVVHSADQGRTWSKPVTVATDTSVPEVDPNAPNDPAKALRAGSGLPSAAIDPRTGELYVAYEGAEFTGGQYDAIQLVHSTDGGRTWSGPTRINQAPGAPAFTPSIAVDTYGAVTISYYDLRYLSPGNTTTLPTAAWLVTFPRGGQEYPSERRISRVFDWLQAPYAGWGHFLGDYEGITTDGRSVRPLLIETNDSNPLNSTDAYSGLFPSGSRGPLTAPATAFPRTAVQPRTAHPFRR
ncbi:sialidase family protein [Streptomyces sp. H10-C2]|uniref:sialidase family protein n=1 Tax=unclassified Streptomyces TaxID=2593676 RepID=UPI0024B90F51|nr:MULTISPECIES: sialidase family protein [unclassified Streptomyces]MDJ0343945.1 sialidase family protein [Streptomyces sp. PH10-H1]MDJ0373386.1 sialidase family protein [Streptomyces sp. H10-C2]